MAKHTPAPWEWVIENGDIEIRMGDAIESSGDHLAHNSFKYVDMIETYQKEQKEQAIANANLIAAAPELLEVVEELIGTIENAPDPSMVSDHIKIVKEVIQKTRGDNDARINR